MQVDLRKYDPSKHVRYRALSVKQPYAQLLIEGSKYIEVRSRNTTYRGDLLLCSSRKPEFPGMMSGVTLGFIELYATKPVAEFTEEDWRHTRVPRDMWGKFEGGYGWLMRNPRRVVEIPVKGMLGIYTAVFEKDDIVEYPTAMTIDKKGWDYIKKQLKHTK